MSASINILIVDDNKINRKTLASVLSEEYNIIEAENGRNALAIIKNFNGQISAILLDLIMPVMDGYEFIKSFCRNPIYKNIPVIVTAYAGDNENEIKALELGAWDFVSKPYDPVILKFRLKNAIDRSLISAYEQLKFLAEYDTLTGIYNKTKFFEETRHMLDANPKKQFVFVTFDIDRFQLVNSFYGPSEGDNLLSFIAREIRKYAKQVSLITYGRINSDIFCFCCPFDQKSQEDFIDNLRTLLSSYNPNYDIIPSFGLYIINDPNMTVEAMYNNASVAAKTCKGNYLHFHQYYKDEMGLELLREEKIISEMNTALADKQFCFYLQPKYDLKTKSIAGAEALVRWVHPEKGIIYPSEFIPIFERNGFISKLDFYVLESVCIQLKKWIDQGIKPFPLSVNISRVNLHNPKLVDIICGLTDTYNIPHELLTLELTESAYTDNPVAMCETMQRLQDKGFIIMMDDFGSGYSSLNILKDIAVDVIKIDMQFFANTPNSERGKNIVASVVRMTKWLKVPVIAEGVEKADQIEFLCEIGCEYVQGYYFAKPMPVPEYESLADFR